MSLFTASGRTYDKQLAAQSAVRFFVATAVTILILAITGYFIDCKLESAAQAENEQLYLDTASANLHGNFFESLGDLFILAQRKNLFAHTAAAKKALSQALINVANIRRNYDQLRLLDTTGREVVRVNYNNGFAQAIPEEDLQDMQNQYYFQRARALNTGEVFVSRMDLNVEHGEIERPFKPVIHMATPVVDEQGKHRGILILNIFAAKILGMLAAVDADSQSKLMFLNEESYWLYSDTEQNNWGFQLPHGRKFSDLYNDPWRRIQETNDGQFRAGNNLYTYRKIGSFSGLNGEQNSRYSTASSTRIIKQESGWYLVSVINIDLLTRHSYHRAKITSIGILLILLCLAPVSYFWGKRYARNIYDSQRINAYASIIENADEIIYIVSRDGRILFINPAFERHVGYKISDVIGKSPSIFKSGRHPQEFYKLLWETIINGEIFEGVFANKKKDGSLFYESKKIMPIRGPEGKVEYFVSIGSNLSDRHDTNLHELQIASQISTSVPHHFSNLLNIIMGYIQLSLDTVHNNDTAVLKQYLNASLDAAIKAEGLIAKIAKARHKQIATYPLINIVEILQRLIDSMKPALAGNINLTLVVKDNPPMIHGNTELIETAIMALLKNAEESLGNSGNIHVETRMMSPVTEVCINCGEPIHGEQLQISVSDNGTGIDADMKSKIFDPFFTVKESAQLVAITPGLGLTMVRGIVHLHGGHLLLQSEPGEGTTVSMLFPIKTENAVAL